MAAAAWRRSSSRSCLECSQAKARQAASAAWEASSASSRAPASRARRTPGSARARTSHSTPATSVRRSATTSLDDIANRAGVSRDEAAGGLADLIPGLVDGLTPEGSVPDDNSLQGRITDIGKMFGG
ncbi:MAG: YidB family protein [Thermoleophilia bacterium]